MPDRADAFSWSGQARLSSGTSAWRRSGHDRLWFMGGNLQHARTYSKFLALQVKADEESLLPGAPV
jgi:hypothetical protein